MKIACLFIYVSSSILTFAFWKFEGPCLTAINTKTLKPEIVSFKDSLFINEDFLDSATFDKTDVANFIFNYNHDTGYILIHRPHHNQFSLIQRLKFLIGKNEHIELDFFELKKDFFLIKNQLSMSSYANSYTKESSDLVTKKWYYTRRAHHFTEQKYRTRKELLIDFQYPQPTKNFSLTSGLTIKNKKKKVDIVYNNQKINFQQALMNHFNNDKNYAVIIDAISQSKFQDNTEKNLPFNSFSIGQAAHEIQNNRSLILLENSTILAIYAVFKDDKNRDSILWGLAEDNKTKKRFHWITDLNKDLSILFD